jgi:dolichol-phosphate mannosyltransferase
MTQADYGRNGKLKEFIKKAGKPLLTSIIIPTYNEAENLPKLVSAIFSLPLELSILVVDDASPDGTGLIAEELRKTYKGRIEVIHRSGKLGLSSAYLEAFKFLLPMDTGLIVQMDSDFSHDPAVLVDMTDRIKTCDLVLGSRYIPGGSTDERWPFWRKALSAWGNFYARTILGMPIRDVTGGFRMWRKETLQAMPLTRVRSSGYVFMVEMAYLAYCLGFNVGEVPIYFADRRWGKSKMSFRIQVEAAFRVWQVLLAYRDLRGKGRLGRVS